METEDEDLAPLSRERCFTWPLAPPPDVLHHVPPPQPSTSATPETHPVDGSAVEGSPSLAGASMAYRGQFYGDPSIPPTSTSTSSKKPNPWGEQSYADLITQALYSSPTGRLKLNEVYQWFSDNVAFFSERSSTEAASGWKNSIRHNLSLHARFMRVTNEGAGKSSWWVLNPDAKPGKSTRRRAHTMEAAQRPAMERKRQRAKRKVDTMGAQGSTGDVMISPHADDDSFRARSDSTLSNYSTPASRISPPSEADTSGYWPHGVDSGLVDVTDVMRMTGLQSMPTYRSQPYLPNSMVGATFATPPNPTASFSTLAPVKTEFTSLVKGEAESSVRPTPPTYNDLYPRFGATGTLLRETLQRGLPSVPAGAHLPFDIATIDCGNWHTMDVDTQAVIQHEMRFDGKLDFTALERM